MRREGFSLVEAMVAMMILALVTSAVILMTLQILALTASTRLKNQATVFAEQMIEQVRDYYQTKGFGILAAKGGSNGTCYLDILGWTVATGNCLGCPESLRLPGTNFYRYAVLTTTPENVKVSAFVSWNDRGVCNKTTQIDTYFYNY